MKAFLLERVRESSNPTQTRNVVREYLQARILECLQRTGAFVQLAFHGGTALRFLYSLPRYSEDLDFTLEGAEQNFHFNAYLKTIKGDMTAEGYAVELKVNDKKTVHSAFIGFKGLLHELKLSPHRGEIISVKLEIDTHPPEGALLETTLVRRYVTLQIQHHDRATLFSGKIHSILSRRYTKGRDIYDLFWYLTDPTWPKPNLTHLNHALRQTGWSGYPLNGDTWRTILREKLESLSWEKVIRDVRPFLEKTAELEFLTLSNLTRLLKSRNN